MKQESIEIRVTNNGYFVSPLLSNYRGEYIPDGVWSFESMAALQKRLPEIIGEPFEKRKKETNTCHGGGVG